MVWIPSHIGIKGNEQADVLAKRATEKIAVDIPFQKDQKVILQEIEAYILKRWQEKYDNISTDSIYKMIEPLVNKHIKATHKIRAFETFVARIRTETLFLNNYKYKRKLHPTGLCDTCNEPETVSHLILHCKKYTFNRNRNNNDKIENILQNETELFEIYEEVKKGKRKL